MKAANTFTTLPPAKLVETWLKLSEESDEHKYAKKRATDILLLIFGDLVSAQAYVDKTISGSKEHQVA